MKNYRQKGENITFTASAAYSSGDVALEGSLIGIVAVDVASGATDGEMSTQGVYEVDKKTTDTPGQFDLAYWDDTLKEVTTTVGTNKILGVFMQAYLNTDTLAEVRLNGHSV